MENQDSLNQSRNQSRHTWFRAQDVVWLLLFAALALISPRQSRAELEMLGLMALLELAGGRIAALNSARGNLFVILLKLVLGFLLIGVTGGILSSYYLILLVPVVAAATTLGALGATSITVLACGAYALFLPVAQSLGYDFSPDLLREVLLRIIFLIAVGFLTYQLADSNRSEVLRAQAVADQLALAVEDLQKAQDAVRRSERLAALGQLTAGLAHELRNPMGTMKASAELLLQRLESGNEISRELAGYISSEVDRANSLITRFLEFARPMQLRRTAVLINDLLDGVVEQIRRSSPKALIHLNYAPDIPMVPLDPQLMERVFLNLIQNALDASADGSGVTVKTRAVAGGVEVSVIDRGSGIDASHREQIFNPFFTTKPTGVGLGLAIVAKIVDEHRGRVTVESETGKGSIFQVFLPR